MIAEQKFLLNESLSRKAAMTKKQLNECNWESHVIDEGDFIYVDLPDGTTKKFSKSKAAQVNEYAKKAWKDVSEGKSSKGKKLNEDTGNPSETGGKKLPEATLNKTLAPKEDKQLLLDEGGGLSKEEAKTLADLLAKQKAFRDGKATDKASKEEASKPGLELYRELGKADIEWKQPKARDSSWVDFSSLKIDKRQSKDGLQSVWGLLQTSINGGPHNRRQVNVVKGKQYVINLDGKVIAKNPSLEEACKTAAVAINALNKKENRSGY